MCACVGSRRAGGRWAFPSVGPDRPVGRAGALRTVRAKRRFYPADDRAVVARSRATATPSPPAARARARPRRRTRDSSRTGRCPPGRAPARRRWLWPGRIRFSIRQASRAKQCSPPADVSCRRTVSPLRTFTTFGWKPLPETDRSTVPDRAETAVPSTRPRTAETNRAARVTAVRGLRGRGGRDRARRGRRRGDDRARHPPRRPLRPRHRTAPTRR